jgi:YD repeat-containing protein
MSARLHHRSAQSYRELPAGRVTQQTLPDGRVILFTYDSNVNVTSLTPTGRPLHAFDCTQVDLESLYAPPNAQPPLADPHTLYSYNLDRQLTRITRPDGGIVDFAYDGPWGTRWRAKRGGSQGNRPLASRVLCQIPSHASAGHRVPGGLLPALLE